jgi:rhamnulokinase
VRDDGVPASFPRAAMTTFLAIDLGAESGRAMTCRFDGRRIAIDEVARFPNVPRRVAGALRWDVEALLGHVTAAVQAVLVAEGSELASIGVDTWGVDYGLVDAAGGLLEDPVHYRDERTTGMLDAVADLVSLDELYALTGVQVLPINTLFQLYAARDTAALRQAATLLFMPDLFGLHLTGERVAERTVASTSQLLDIHRGGWATGLLERLGLPAGLLPPLVEAGTVLGPLRAALAGASRVPVVAVAGHDTASAVLGIPAESADIAYISSGTWSLVGVELAKPVVSDAARQANFTNEAGFGGTVRYLKNVTGLWLVQESRRAWAAQGRDYSYAELTHLAAAAPPAMAIIDPDDPAFAAPGNMPERIRARCVATGQPPPDGVGDTVRCILTSLAVAYRRVLDLARSTSGAQIEAVHVVGGGARNALLCQMTADATGLPVIAGPAEATALGNALAQAHALGLLGSRADLRTVARHSTDVTVFSPGPERNWWEELVARGGRPRVPCADSRSTGGRSKG